MVHNLPDFYKSFMFCLSSTLAGMKRYTSLRMKEPWPLAKISPHFGVHADNYGKQHDLVVCHDWPDLTHVFHEFLTASQITYFIGCQFLTWLSLSTGTDLNRIRRECCIEDCSMLVLAICFVLGLRSEETAPRSHFHRVSLCQNVRAPSICTS